MKDEKSLIGIGQILFSIFQKLKRLYLTQYWFNFLKKFTLYVYYEISMPRFRAERWVVCRRVRQSLKTTLVPLTLVRRISWTLEAEVWTQLLWTAEFHNDIPVEVQKWWTNNYRIGMMSSHVKTKRFLNLSTSLSISSYDIEQF